jgi:hypothetical protein
MPDKARDFASALRCSFSSFSWVCDVVTPHIEAPWIQTTGWRWGCATTAPQCAAGSVPEGCAAWWLCLHGPHMKLLRALRLRTQHQTE